MSTANPWLQRQRKSDLLETAQRLGLKDVDDLKKVELEQRLDEYLSEHSARFASDAKLAGYFNSRARIAGSPVKKETSELKVVRARRHTRAPDEVVATRDETDEEESGVAQITQAATNALVQTPGRALSLASRIPLPATPADVAHAVDRGTVAVRERVSSLYQESGITETTEKVQESLSSVYSILLAIQAFELYFLRKEVLADRYAFTIPAIKLLHTDDYPVHIPDMFLILTSSFWSPVLLYVATSVVIPAVFGYFFNLSAANHNHPGRGRARSSQPDYTIDPLTFSIVKALVTFVVYNQGVTFGGLVDELAVARINSALYGGWKGVIAGAAITGVTAIYDAVLKK
ncbi:hypothetical protein BR93DRAFT_932977 [Coniochaeta sp. PMI_546]|nr:hypothetical protein BR93DRAFT_932977 [Coniochaeta sp. PMI_546]